MPSLLPTRLTGRVPRGVYAAALLVITGFELYEAVRLLRRKARS